MPMWAARLGRGSEPGPAGSAGRRRRHRPGSAPPRVRPAMSTWLSRELVSDIEQDAAADTDAAVPFRAPSRTVHPDAIDTGARNELCDRSWHQQSSLRREGQRRELLLAVEEGDTAAVKLLLNAGVPQHELRDGTLDSTLLHTAAMYGEVAVAQLLLRHGAVVNAVDAHLCTPLHWAAQWNSGQNEAMIELLLSAGAAPELKDTVGETAIDKARRTATTSGEAGGAVDMLEAARASLQKSTVDSLFEAIDTDGSGSIDREELAAFLRECCLSIASTSDRLRLFSAYC